MQALDLPWPLIYFVTEWRVRVIMLAVVPLRRTPQAASAWLLLIMFLPWVGLALYLLIGRPSMPAWRKQRIARFTEAMRPVSERLPDSPALEAPALPARQQAMAVLAARLGHLPPCNDNATELLVDYARTLDSLARDIDAAQHHVLLLYYIFAADEATRAIVSR